METPKHICEKCGENHPTETHDNLVMMKLTNPDYLPSRQEVLDVTRPHIYKDDENSREQRFYKDHEIREMGHEILNKEFIEALANYLTTRIAEYQTGDGPITILEVGAGNGRLARFLRQELNNLAPHKFEYIATNLSDGVYDRKPAFQVEDMDYQQALKKYNPTIVICSWMPYQDDWTTDFRDTASVQEYILIGEQASTGDAWETWGDPIEAEGYPDQLHGEFAGPAPYIEEGFKETYLEDITEQQIKSPIYGSQINPATYSFRRVSK